jgi:hypothetical protein
MVRVLQRLIGQILGKVARVSGKKEKKSWEAERYWKGNAGTGY